MKTVIIDDVDVRSYILIMHHILQLLKVRFGLHVAMQYTALNQCGYCVDQPWANHIDPCQELTFSLRPPVARYD